MLSIKSRSLTARHWREWIGFVLAFASLFAYAYVSLGNSHQRIQTREQERLTHQCDVVAMNLSRQFSAINSALTGIVKEVSKWRSMKDGAQLAAQHLRALNNAMPSVLTFLIFDADGTVRASDKQELAEAA